MSNMKKEIFISVDSRLEKLIPQFLTLQQKDLAALESALSALDYEELSRLGHRLKGGCGSYGFHDLSRLGALIESCADQKDPTHLQDYVAQIKEQLIAAKIIFVKNKGA